MIMVDMHLSFEFRVYACKLYAMFRVVCSFTTAKYVKRSASTSTSKLVGTGIATTMASFYQRIALLLLAVWCVAHGVEALDDMYW